MALYQTIGEDLKQAMKSGDSFRRDTLRLLQSAIKNVAIEKRQATETLSQEEIEAVLRRLTKQRKDSIAQYQAGARLDLAEKEQAEHDLLVAYLPQAMGEVELMALVRETLVAGGFTAKSQMGQAMGAVMKKVGVRSSGDDVRKQVATFLV